MMRQCIKQEPTSKTKNLATNQAAQKPMAIRPKEKHQRMQQKRNSRNQARTKWIGEERKEHATIVARADTWPMIVQRRKLKQTILRRKMRKMRIATQQMKYIQATTRFSVTKQLSPTQAYLNPSTPWKQLYKSM